MEIRDQNLRELDGETRATMGMIKKMFRKINRTGSAECRLCGHVVHGTNFGEILQKLGEHGDVAHPDFL